MIIKLTVSTYSHYLSSRYSLIAMLIPDGNRPSPTAGTGAGPTTGRQAPDN